jgi:hypothetical protein
MARFSASLAGINVSSQSELAGRAGEMESHPPGSVAVAITPRGSIPRPVSVSFLKRIRARKHSRGIRAGYFNRRTGTGTLLASATVTYRSCHRSTDRRRGARGRRAFRRPLAGGGPPSLAASNFLPRLLGAGNQHKNLKIIQTEPTTA